MKRVAIFSSWSIVLLASLQVIRADSYTFTSLGNWGSPNAINNAGQIVGTSIGGQQTSSLLYVSGILAPIAVPGSDNTFAYGINNAGQIVGSYSISGAGSSGFVDSNGVFTTIIVPGNSNARSEERRVGKECRSR